jgi:uncharacterized membrane protein YtjA (UPF0391 family)
MLHWTRSFLAVGLIAALFAYGGWVPVFTGAAKLIFWLFLALAALALVANALGRGPDGSYSGERAFAVVALLGGVVWLSHVWLKEDWSAAEARRAAQGGIEAVASSANGLFR